MLRGLSVLLDYRPSLVLWTDGLWVTHLDSSHGWGSAGGSHDAACAQPFQRGLCMWPMWGGFPEKSNPTSKCLAYLVRLVQQTRWAQRPEGPLSGGFKAGDSRKMLVESFRTRSQYLLEGGDSRSWASLSALNHTGCTKNTECFYPLVPYPPR